MNISQHCFIPRTKIQKGKIYNASGSLINSSVNDTFEPQVRFDLNTVYFPQIATTTKYAYKVTYFEPYSQGSSDNIPENRIGILDRESELIAFGNNFSLYPNTPRGMVYEIAWYQPQSTVLRFVSPNSLQELDEKLEESKKITEEIENLF